MDDPTSPLPLVPPSGSPVSGGAEAEPLPAAAAAPSSSSLDTTETSENDYVKQFLASKEVPTTAAREQPLWELESVRFRHSGWAPVRNRIWKALKRTGQSESRINAFALCGAGTWLQRSAEGIEPVQYRICGSCCHDRLCTPCANARSSRLKLALMTAMKGKRMSFITLTLAGKDDGLAEKVDRLYRHFKALRNHPLWFERVRGGAAFLEIKWSDKAQRWHPHLHCICDADFIDQGELSTVWRTITKDSYIVDVRRVRDDDQAAGYVTKYASKPLNPSFSNDPELLDEAVVALKGRRLCMAFGDWYGTPLDFDTDELLDEDELPSTAWRNYIPLHDAIYRANHGEAYFRDLIIAAGGEVKWRNSLLLPRDPMTME